MRMFSLAREDRLIEISNIFQGQGPKCTRKVATLFSDRAGPARVLRVVKWTKIWPKYVSFVGFAWVSIGFASVFLFLALFEIRRRTFRAVSQ